MNKLIPFFFTSITYLVIVITATKASVHGHIYHHIRFYYLLGLAVICFTTWFSLNARLRMHMLKTYEITFKGIYFALFAAFVTLIIIDGYIDTSLVSNRSYGTIFWSTILISGCYGIWSKISNKYKESKV